MSLSFDPERNEIDSLLEFAGDLKGSRVLEIGSGAGRLTWRYAAQARQVQGIDPNPDRIAHALNEMPANLRSRVTLLESTLQDYKNHHQGPLFHLALMSWSL